MTGKEFSNKRTEGPPTTVDVPAINLFTFTLTTGRLTLRFLNILEYLKI
jgi:hypothetical protein